MNNHCVPDFGLMDDEYSMPTTSSGLTRPKKSALAEAEVMELLWQNGQVVAQSQNQKPPKKSHFGSGGGGEAAIPADQAAAREIRSNVEETIPQQHRFIHEDEMASWLHYPLDESTFEPDLYADLLYSGPSATVTTAAPSREINTSTVEIRPPPTQPTAALMAVPPRPPIPPPPTPRRTTDTEGSHQFQNFAGHFQRLPKLGSEPGRPPHSSCKSARETAVVDSNETPIMAEQESRASNAADSVARVSGWNVVGGGCSTMNGTTAVDTSMSNREPSGTCDRTITSSPGASAGSMSVSASGEPPHPPPRTAEPTAGEDRKRKGRENDVIDDAEGHSEDAEIEFGHTRKQARSTTSAKRSRAAEVHNLSERRRRDRINEKMRALQELIPRCNKADKASMLDEAIEYLKSLQLQVQMMSMGCNMVPMMYPGMQQYMPMGMGMEMGLSRPMMPYPPMLPGSAMQNAAQMGPRFPMQPFYMPGVHVADPSRIQASNQPDPMLNSLAAHNSNHPRLPNFTDPYQQFFGLHQAQVALQQNQAVEQPSNNKPRRSKEVGNPGNHQSG